ncbi:MAG TPA: efflux RND transporter periplasmic adaptor subunit [Verrucomicrobiae bacterium]|nr:efflux RND transporter periplasmic adaptor subunit [Verrucomicrobiae bacterium]
MKRKLLIPLVVLVAVAAGFCYARVHRAHSLVLTGIVTTDEVIVSSEIQGRLQRLFVQEGDAVTNGQLLAVIQPQEWQADVAFYSSNEKQAVSLLAQAKADLENAELTFQREEKLYATGANSAQEYDAARTSRDGAQARVDALNRQIQAARAQEEKAQVQLGYTETYAPINGIVDTRAALQGEVVNPGQGIVTLIDPDNLWVRADVEETYIDRIHLGDKFTVRLPSGAQREGTVFYRAVDADYATQRDVSRTKRDIKTFEIRLRCDNRDRSLAVGMTAYVLVPLGTP